ncbi:hypothetical protein BI343_16600 [Chromobacterium amazonense]|uniref:DUF2804 domain-containing protein n=1 Tax=Chromobacterium amazonense TaxID=1382803 RepID=UPI0008D9ACA5|nr:DUF2804 domain-containing protein [Chromobacterium amazonense]OHX15600.1 hypothetical protein BI343_16600 [Chromobacterium amazonense]
MTLLPAAPPRLLDAPGRPAFGVYQGIVDDLSWQALALTPRQRLTRPLHHKRWQYAALAHADFFIGFAIVDVGWNGTAFAYLFDRRRRQVTAAASANGLPGLGAQVDDRVFGHARFRLPGHDFRFQRDGDALRLSLSSRKLTLDAVVDLSAAPPVLAAIAPANYLAHSTHKSGGLAVSGEARCAGGRFDLAGAVASLDYSNGLLARETRWRWASAHGRNIGFNLQQGFMGDAENAVWLHGKLFRVGAASFDYQPNDPLAPWRVASADGVVDLTFTPEGARREDKNLLIAASRYVQPIGRFNGTLIDPDSGERHPVRELVGVTEDHVSRW